MKKNGSKKLTIFLLLLLAAACVAILLLFTRHVPTRLGRQVPSKTKESLVELKYHMPSGGEYHERDDLSELFENPESETNSGRAYVDYDNLVKIDVKYLGKLSEEKLKRARTIAERPDYITPKGVQKISAKYTDAGNGLVEGAAVDLISDDGYEYSFEISFMNAPEQKDECKEIVDELVDKMYVDVDFSEKSEIQ